MLPGGSAIIRESSNNDNSFIYQTRLPQLKVMQTINMSDSISSISTQLQTCRNQGLGVMCSSLSTPDSVLSLDEVEKTSMRATCSSGIIEIHATKTLRNGRYLLRIPKCDIGNKVVPVNLWKRVAPTGTPSVSMDGDSSTNESEVFYENGSVSPPSNVEQETGCISHCSTIDDTRFFAPELNLFLPNTAQPSLRHGMVIAESRSVCPGFNFPGQRMLRSFKPKGVKCSECDEMVYSRPLLLRHMTQVHGIFAPLIYKTFSDRENLQTWLEQLRETHAVEFVVSSGSKKWGQGLQVHYLICSRSGGQKERPNKKFRRPTRRSIKCGKNCMAYLKMKQNPTVSELKVEACLHHSGHEIDASKIRLERNEWCRVVKVMQEIEGGSLQIDLWHMPRIREVLGHNGRFRLMTDEGLCQQLPKWIRQHSPQKKVQATEISHEEEFDIGSDPLVSGYDTNMSFEPSLFSDAFTDYEMECLPCDFVCDFEATNENGVEE